MNELNSEPGLSAQVKKIADHLVFLEKKLDLILEQQKNRGSFGARPGNREFQRPGGHYRPMDRPGYPPRHSTRTQHYGGSQPSHSAGGFQKKYVPHRGAR